MIVGQRYRRLDDGREGVAVRCGDGGVRILYRDRGEELIAPKSQQWLPVEDDRSLPLREEEITEVASRADQALAAIDKHEPYRAWERPEGPPHDPGLVRVISAYLRQR